MTGLIVAGMHRSGTSLVAHLLQEGGWHAGEEQLRRADEEYFEDATFVALHRRWLDECLPPGEGHRDWGVARGGDPQPGMLTDAAAAVAEFSATRDRQRPRWVAKDPRASLFLDQWAAIEPLRFVLVYRSPWDVTDSALRLGHPPFCADPSLVRQAWVLHNRRIVEFAIRHRDRCVVIASEALAADPEHAWNLLAGTVGLEGAAPPGLVDGTKLATRDRCHPIAEITRQLHPECADLLDALDELADLPRPAGDATRPWATLLPGGSLPDGTGIQVVVPCRDDGVFLDEAIASVAAACAGPTELTVIDDGSTEPETLRVLEALRVAGYQVEVTAAVGLPAARNVGIRTSRTLAVLPLDADNRLLASLPAGLALIEADDADIVHGSWQEFGLRARRVDPPDASWESLLPTNTIDACALIRRDLLVRVGGYDAALPFLEDWALWLAGLAAGARFHRLPDLTFRYLVRPGSLVATVWDDDARFAAALHRIIDPHETATGAQMARVVHQLLVAMKADETTRQALADARADALERTAAGVREADFLRGQVDAAEAARTAEMSAHAETAARVDAALAHGAEVEARLVDMAGARDMDRVALDEHAAKVEALHAEIAAMKARRGYRLADALSRRAARHPRLFAVLGRLLGRARPGSENDASAEG